MNKNLAWISGAQQQFDHAGRVYGFDRTADQFTQPVVKDVKKG